MIQRIQTVFFFLAIVCLILVNFFPIYISIHKDTGVADVFMLRDQIALVMVSGIIIGGCGYTIFMYKHRKKQLQVTGILLAITLLLNILIAITYKPLAKEMEVHVQIAAFFPLVALLCLILAARGIRHDEKLVRSVDRLR